MSIEQTPPVIALDHGNGQSLDCRNNGLADINIERYQHAAGE